MIERRPGRERTLVNALANARLHVFPETGHNPFVEETEAFIQVVAEFLAETAR